MIERLVLFLIPFTALIVLVAYELVRVRKVRRMAESGEIRRVIIGNKWQPIETAPTDGTVVVVTRNRGEGRFGFFGGFKGKFIDGRWISETHERYIGKPTHWRPKG